MRLFYGVSVPTYEPSRSQTLTTDSRLSVRLFPHSVAASNLFATGANLNIIYDQTQKSGDRGCAGQTRSGVGTLIALIKFMALVERLLLNCARPKQFIGLGTADTWEKNA